MIEKHVDQATLQGEFLERSIDQLYRAAVSEKNLRIVGQPKADLKKFVPFTDLEIVITVSVIGDIKVPDYTKIKKQKTTYKVTDKEVKEVLHNLQLRVAEKKEVTRAAKEKDEVWIDFTGVDAKTKDSIKGAEGKDYPLALGSNTFIPGFEDNLLGLKSGDEKTFTLTFPKDYGVKALANRKVTFTVKVTKVNEVVEPKLDDEFAKQAGPFKTFKELEDDIYRTLQTERQRELDRNYESELVKDITDKAVVDIPETLVDEQVERLMRDVKQNIAYRGQTLQEMLESEGKTEQQYRDEVLRPDAIDRVKAGIVLTDISEKEGLKVTLEELEIRMQVLKGQYKDPQMLAELDKPESRQEIASRMLTEKTINKIVSYATAS
jgi:trigger factor